MVGWQSLGAVFLPPRLLLSLPSIGSKPAVVVAGAGVLNSLNLANEKNVTEETNQRDAADIDERRLEITVLD